MLYASFRGNVVHAARDEGVEVAKRIEIGAPEEVGEERLREELALPGATASAGAEEEGGSRVRQGFARPKRPGKR